MSKAWDTKIGAYILALNVVLLSWSDGKRKLPIAFMIQTTTEEKVSKIDLALELLIRTGRPKTHLKASSKSRSSGEVKTISQPATPR